MKIAVLGTGMVGQAAGRPAWRSWATTVTVGTRDVAGDDGPHRTRRHGQPAVSAPGPPPTRRCALATFAEAAAGAELMVNATSGGVSIAALAAGGRRATWRARCSSTSPTRWTSPSGFPPSLFVKDTDRLGEQIQARIPGAEGRQGAQHADRRR